MNPDRFNEKCIIIDFLPGSCGHFIQKLLYEVTHDMHDLQPTEEGSCHYVSEVVKNLPGSLFDSDYRGNTTNTLKNYISKRYEKYETLIFEPVQQAVDNISRVHSFGRHSLIFETFPNSKIISITNSNSIEYVTSMLLLITKHSLTFHPSGTKLGIVDAFEKPKTKHLRHIKLGKNQTLITDTEAFINVSNNASKRELQYLAYQLVKAFIPGLDLADPTKQLKYYNGFSSEPFSDRLVQLKFEWILTCNADEIINCFETIISDKFTTQQKEYIVDQLNKYMNSQNQDIIKDPFKFINDLKTVHDKVELYYQSERAVNNLSSP